MVKEFAQGDTERRADVATLIREFAAMAPERQAEVATMVKEFAQADAERHSEVWGVAPAKKVAAPRKVAAPPPRVAPPVEELPEEAPQEKPAAEVAPGTEVRDSVFAYLDDHPDGVRLTELEEEFGLARVQMARIVRELMDDNLVEKRDLLYFAI